MDILIPMYDTTGVYELTANVKAFGGMTLDGQVDPASAKIVYYKFNINFEASEENVACEVVKNFEKEIITILSVSYTLEGEEVDAANEVYVSSPILDIGQVGEEKSAVTKGLSFHISKDRRSIYLSGTDILKTKGEIGLTLLVRETIRQ